MEKLLTRNDFRESVFKRDGYKCIICKNPAKDAHHIIDRRLFSDGGYYLNNGASLCEEHHLEAEMTTLSCNKIRELCEIKNIILPNHFDTDEEYDKWGNIILKDGRRIKGELFYDESVQKILEQGNVLDLFVKYIKYPKTPHLPWSPGATKDDKILPSTEQFEGKEVLVSVKMDGECTTMYNDHIYARSINSGSAEWRTRIKRIWSEMSWNIPDEWRICGENLQAKHSIHYSNLESYFMVFSMWDNFNNCLDWKTTLEWIDLLGFQTVPILYQGIWDEKLIKSLYSEKFNEDECEGYVIRTVDKFHYKDFSKNCAKFVRKDHVNSSRHWKHQRMIENILKEKL